MIELFEQQQREMNRHSSKGNQLKWEKDGIWYKADYTGYEGLAEYVISRLLEYSSLKEEEFVRYEVEEIRYRNRILTGTKSQDMLTDDWQIITLERLFKNEYNESLYLALWNMQDAGERLEFLCDQTERITGIQGVGIYLSKLLTIDAFFLNEDRHTHNIAILMNQQGEYRLCPIFDNGAGLLSDTKMDYPMEDDIHELMEEVQAKTVSPDFDEQLDAAEILYGQQLRFYFDKKDVDQIVEEAQQYSWEVRERVKNVIYRQMRKYEYLFQERI